ncbi:MAG: GNAT family N-acetyltransferase [Planctomycetes bacterium]|nr:GNAT family N-acetyltransferase [Planctomycetota bacterium]
MNQLIILKTVNEKDCKDLWLWRSFFRVRKNFFSQRPILWREHKKWFYSKLLDPATKMYLARRARNKIGVIRFETGGPVVKVSVNLNPKFIGKGVGAKIISLGTEKVMTETKTTKPIIAEIKKDNIASSKVFSRAGYVLKEETPRKLIYEYRRT